MSTKSRLLIVVAVVVATAVILVATRRTSPSDGLRAAFDAEFLTRPDGYRGLSERYGFEFASEPMQMDPGLMYRAVADGAVDVIDGFATDGRIKAYNLVTLEDDKGFFPPYYAAPLVREETLKEYPQLATILNRLAGKISDQTMQRLNYEVDEKGRKARRVAREFLTLQGLIDADATPADGSAGTVTVGGKQFTEQEILGELAAILIECNANIRVVRKLNLGGTMICFNALRSGDLDLYPEYTGTGLVNILKLDVIADPDKAYETVTQEFKRRYGLVWLEPFGFNNTYTLTMRRDHAKKLGVETISDLARIITSRQDGSEPQ
jgi:osmoprotectant transport system permease protein